MSGRLELLLFSNPKEPVVVIKIIFSSTGMFWSACKMMYQLTPRCIDSNDNLLRLMFCRTNGRKRRRRVRTVRLFRNKCYQVKVRSCRYMAASKMIWAAVLSRNECETVFLMVGQSKYIVSLDVNTSWRHWSEQLVSNHIYFATEGSIKKIHV